MSEKWKTEFFEWKDGIEAKFNNLSQKNTELEKKFEEHLKDDSEEIRNELARQVDLIAELKKENQMFCYFLKYPCNNLKCYDRETCDNEYQARSDKTIVEQINELKSDIGNINKILEVITEGRVLELRAFNNLEYVLQVFIKEVGNYLDTDRFEYLLEKLDSSKQPEIDMIGKLLENAKKVVDKVEQMEKKDSEVLKDIKELAKAESDFYNKHGYFSFWSDQLKIQRIKELKNKKGSEGEKDVSEVDETGGATPTRNVELDTSSLLGDDSKPPEILRKWDLIDILENINYIAGILNNTLRKIKEKEKATGPEKELYELYQKDKEQYYFKKITHPFTELNNMVHLGVGMKLTPYDTEEKLIEGFIKVLKTFKCGCGDGFDLQIIEAYEGLLNK